MANAWFRMYSEFADDPKVQMMSEAMQRRLVMLMCSRCKGETLHETEMAFHWRCSESDVAETKAIFTSKGFIDDDWNLPNWNKRQFISDSSTDRARRFRERKKQSETLHETDATKLKQSETVSVTAPEQNRTEQIQNRKTTSPLAQDEFLTSWNANKGNLPEVKSLTASRKKKLACRVKEGLTTSDFTSAVKLAARTPFCRGENDRGWKLDFDFLIENDTNLTKVLEGKYGTPDAAPLVFREMSITEALGDFLPPEFREKAGAA